MDVTVVYNRISHHAGPSGYDRLVDYLAPRVPVHRLEHYRPSVVPEAVQNWAANHAGMEWYDVWSLALESAAVRRALRRDRQIYHFLYAGDSYRYFAHARPLLRMKSSAVVCSYHQPPEILDRVVQNKTPIKSLDAIVVMSNNQADYFRSLVAGDRVFVVPHGIDTDHYRPGSEAQRDPRLCLAVGQWLRDFDMLRDVSRLVSDRDRRIRFRIITREEHRGLFDGLPNVQFLSDISDEELLRAYQNAGILVLPLKDCTANNSVLEALACGLPVIGNDVGGIRDYVTPECMRLVARGDVDGMADHIVSLVADDATRREMGGGARRRALELSWPRIAERQLAVYGAVAAEIGASTTAVAALG